MRWRRGELLEISVADESGTRPIVLSEIVMDALRKGMEVAVAGRFPALALLRTTPRRIDEEWSP